MKLLHVTENAEVEDESKYKYQNKQDISENNLFGMNIISNSKKYLYASQFPDNFSMNYAIPHQVFPPFGTLP